MKKYLFALSALILAIAFSAFTKPTFTSETFRFTGSDPNSISQIEDVTNYVRVTSLDCPTNVDDKVCEIVVDDLYYTGSGASAELNDVDPVGSDEQMVIKASTSSNHLKIGQNPDVFIDYRIIVAQGTLGTPKNKDIVTF